MVLSFSGRELFLSDASLFVDDAEAYEKYQREESDGEEKVRSPFSIHFVFCCVISKSNIIWLLMVLNL